MKFALASRSASVRQHTARYDGRLLTVSGSTAIYQIVDVASPGYDPCIPQYATWRYEYPAGLMLRDTSGMIEGASRLRVRRQRVESTIEQSLRHLLDGVARLGGMWRVIEDLPDAGQVVDCAVEVYLPADAIRSDGLAISGAGDCADVPGMLSQIPQIAALLGERRTTTAKPRTYELRLTARSGNSCIYVACCPPSELQREYLGVSVVEARWGQRIDGATDAPASSRMTRQIELERRVSGEISATLEALQALGYRPLWRLRYDITRYRSSLGYHEDTYALEISIDRADLPACIPAALLAPSQ
jgi:hypothetical protein